MGFRSSGIEYVRLLPDSSLVERSLKRIATLNSTKIPLNKSHYIELEQDQPENEMSRPAKRPLKTSTFSLKKRATRSESVEDQPSAATGNEPPKKPKKVVVPVEVDAVPEPVRNEEPVAKPKTPKPEKVAVEATSTEKPAKKTGPTDESLPTFFELGLAEPIARAVAEMGFETPTPIQAKAIPVLITGRDLIALAQTGTGKTAAFGLPLIQRIDPANQDTQALVLAPTRELAVQVAEGIHNFAKNSGLKIVPVYGGQPIDRQFRALRGGAQVVVGTPGRVLDHLRRGSLTITNVKLCILDEADEMLALGFTEDLDAILDQLPESRQLAFFSATMPARILTLTKKFLRDPVNVTIKSKQRTVDTTNQTYYEVPKGKKLEALARVLDMETPGPTIVFCRTRQETNDLCDNLRLRGYNSEALHGDMNQAERDRVMRKFRDGQADLLVATDVAARGLDIETVTHVINYDIPWDVEQYIHRIGRTGRAGRTGDAITLVSGRERQQLKNIERMIGSVIKPARIPTASDIAARRRENFKVSLLEVLRGGEFESQMVVVDELAEEFETSEIAAAALYALWKSQHTAKDAAVQDMAHDFEQPEMGMKRIFVGMGRADGLRPGDLVGAISNEAGLQSSQIGVIDIHDKNSFVEVPSALADGVVQVLSNTKLRNKKVKVMLAQPGEVKTDDSDLNVMAQDDRNRAERPRDRGPYRGGRSANQPGQRGPRGPRR